MSKQLARVDPEQLDEIDRIHGVDFAWIYVIRCKDMYKIGKVKALNPRRESMGRVQLHGERSVYRRLKELQIGNHRRMRLIHYFFVWVGSLEEFIHGELAHCRVRGEWFRLGKREVDWLLSCDGGRIPTPPWRFDGSIPYTD